MTASPAMLIRQWLLDHASPEVTDPADAQAWPCFVGSMPDEPDGRFDNVVTLYDTTGVRQARTLSGVNVQSYGVQLRVRALAYDTGWAKITSICKQLEALKGATVTIPFTAQAYVIQTASQQAPAGSIGSDPTTRRRENFTANFLVHVTGE